MRYTLVTDGSSDRTLIPIINWSLHDVGFFEAIEPNWADLRRLPPSRRTDLRTRILTAIELFPCDLIFIHRDAEGHPREDRARQIVQAAPLVPSAIPVVPVRMTEAWLLHDTDAIRRAAGNPNGNDELSLPALEDTEQVIDPKEVLYQALRDACGLNVHRRAKLDVKLRAHRVAELTTDFSPLRRLPAFVAFQDDLRIALTALPR